MNNYRAKDGERIDLICWKHYGSLSGRVVEQVLSVNPGISVALELMSGAVIMLPDIAPQTEESSLW
jgi:phage tail protein X